MTGPGLFGDEGRRVLDGEERELFPVAVRSAVLRWLWAVLVLLAAVAAVLFVAAGARLS
jgi:hypothetical protein